jgi:hypothetical protein
VPNDAVVQEFSLMRCYDLMVASYTAHSEHEHGSRLSDLGALPSKALDLDHAHFTSVTDYPLVAHVDLKSAPRRPVPELMPEKSLAYRRSDLAKEVRPGYAT